MIHQIFNIVKTLFSGYNLGMTSFTHSTYISPFTWRYGSKNMRFIWSEENKRLLLRSVWVALATAQNKVGLVTDEELSDLKAHQKNIDIERAEEIENEIHHDLMAEIKTYAEQCKIGGGKIHLGATSTDALDNAEAIRLKDAIRLIKSDLDKVVASLDELIKNYGDTPCMAYTHLQSAEETIYAHRFSLWKESIEAAIATINNIKIYGKGFKGAVGNYSGYDVLLKGKTYKGKPFTALDMEKIALKELDLDAFKFTCQVYPRYQDLSIMQALSLIAAVSAKIAFDIRLLQSPGFGELSEYFSSHQVGSSAMPFKKNPINAEKINSIARFVHSLESSAWENTANSALERTLDDSANRRLFLPEGFLGVDEILITLEKELSTLTLNTNSIELNREKFGVFAATEGVMMKAVENGGNRQELHEVIREASIKAKAELEKSGTNPLKTILSEDKRLLKYLKKDEILTLLSTSPELPTIHNITKGDNHDN